MSWKSRSESGEMQRRQRTLSRGILFRNRICYVHHLAVIADHPESYYTKPGLGNMSIEIYTVLKMTHKLGTEPLSPFLYS